MASISSYLLHGRFQIQNKKSMQLSASARCTAMVGQGSMDAERERETSRQGKGKILVDGGEIDRDAGSGDIVISKEGELAHDLAMLDAAALQYCIVFVCGFVYQAKDLNMSLIILDVTQGIGC